MKMNETMNKIGRFSHKTITLIFNVKFKRKTYFYEPGNQRLMWKPRFYFQKFADETTSKRHFVHL
jgi:hypothetical protein